MKTMCILLTSAIFFLMISSTAYAQLQPESHLEGTLGSETTAFFLGRTTVSGSLPGYPMESLINSTLVEDMTAFPLLGRNRLNNVDSIFVVNTQEYSFETISDFFPLNEASYSFFSHVDLVTETGFFLFGILGGNITFQSDFNYAISGVFAAEIIPETPASYYVVLGTDPIETRCTGQQFALFGLSENCSLRIEDATTGNILWDNDTKDTLFVIGDTSFSLTQDSLIHLFPLYSEASTEMVSFSVSPADLEDVDPTILLDEMESSFSVLGDINFTNFSKNIPGFETILSTASTMMNGAMVVVGNATILVDETQQPVENVCFTRNSIINGKIEGAQTHEMLITGNSKLIFLDDHLYNPQAKQSKNGVAFPFELIIIWVLAIVVFILFHFFYKPQINQKRDTMVKWYALVFHIAMLILAFILLDREISYLFGMSAFDALFSQGFTLIFAVFLGVELLLWTLGFLILAIPVRILTQSGLRLIGIGKGGKGIGKGVGAICIWIFCALYVNLFINVLLSLLLPEFLLPLG